MPGPCRKEAGNPPGLFSVQSALCVNINYVFYLIRVNHDARFILHGNAHSNVDCPIFFGTCVVSLQNTHLPGFQRNGKLLLGILCILQSIPNEKVFLYRISMCFGITLISKRILVVYRDDFYMLLILGHDRYHFILRR